MEKNAKPAGEIEPGDFQIVEGELLEVSTGREVEAADEQSTVISPRRVPAKSDGPKTGAPMTTALQKVYIFLPMLFLTVTLLGGLRLSSPANDFIFLRPALFCLIAAAILLVLFFRAGLVRLEGWFSEDFSTLTNAANGAVLLTLFTASVQIFNALLPEQGLPFWVFAFCFFWTLWNNLFADFETKKLLRSLGALFGLAFVVKYMILAGLTAPGGGSWWQAIWQNPAKEAFTWLLDLPRYSAGTGYIQFFTVVFYLIGLFLLPPSPAGREDFRKNE